MLWQQFFVAERVPGEVYPPINMRKLIVTSRNSLKLVYLDATKQRQVEFLDFSNFDYETFDYNNIASPPKLTIDYRRQNQQQRIRAHIPSDEEARDGNTLTILGESFGTETFPQFILFDATSQTETETDEPATATITFEYPTWLLADILFRRLSKVTHRFVNGLNSQYVALRTKVRNVAGAVGENEHNQRYDHMMNWGRLLIGHTWEQIQKYQDVATPAGERPTAAEIEGLVEKCESQFPHVEATEQFFIDQDHKKWYINHQHRNISLANEDGTPGETLRTINDEYYDPATGVDHAAAEEEFGRCVKTCFGLAWADKRRVLRKTIQYSYGWSDNAVTFPQSQLTDPSTLEEQV